MYTQVIQYLSRKNIVPGWCILYHCCITKLGTSCSTSNDGNGYEKHSYTLWMTDATGSFVQLVGAWTVSGTSVNGFELIIHISDNNFIDFFLVSSLFSLKCQCI